jgi:hypothetical protein
MKGCSNRSKRFERLVRQRTDQPQSVWLKPLERFEPNSPEAYV